MSLALLKAPGHWGEQGADIACGEGQPLGVPLSSGGPYFGFMTCKQKHVRQMPGRIVGRTTDLDGNPGFALTLQAREQHIRRSKATSNICTNQGLMVTAATIYMSLLGFEGLASVARKSHANTTRLVDGLCTIDGIDRLYDAPYFHEVALKFDRPVAPVLAAIAEKNILGGFDLTGERGHRRAARLCDGNQDRRRYRRLHRGVRRGNGLMSGTIVARILFDNAYYQTYGELPRSAVVHLTFRS